MTEVTAAYRQRNQMDAMSALMAALGAVRLRVESRKDWADVLVVDHAEKTPTEN